MNDEEKCDFTIKYRWRYERLYMKSCSNRHRVTFCWAALFRNRAQYHCKLRKSCIDLMWYKARYKVLWLKVLYGNVCRMHRIQMAQKTRRALSITQKTHNSLSMALECAVFRHCVRCGAMQSTTCRPNSKLISIWHDFQFQLNRYALSLEKTLE